MYTSLRAHLLLGVDQFVLISSPSPRKAGNAIDPQQRLLLETNVEALEHARHGPGGLYGNYITGVFLGMSNVNYAAVVRRPG